eukprot:4339689-Pleurochrysis_carterae.AAC.1
MMRKHLAISGFEVPSGPSRSYYRLCWLTSLTFERRRAQALTTYVRASAFVSPHTRARPCRHTRERVLVATHASASLSPHTRA